jgi:hypothetical protein
MFWAAPSNEVDDWPQITRTKVAYVQMIFVDAEKSSRLRLGARNARKMSPNAATWTWLRGLSLTMKALME